MLTNVRSNAMKTNMISWGVSAKAPHHCHCAMYDIDESVVMNEMLFQPVANLH